MTKKIDKKSIIIFEDDEETRKEMKVDFKKEFSKTGIPIGFFEATDSGSQKVFEKRLKKDLKNKSYGNIGFIVCDRDLSGMRNYIGLSAANVLSLADELVVPICLYARGIYEDISAKIRGWTELKIILDISRGYRKMAYECKILYEGFQMIESRYKQIKRKRKERYTLPDILARILEKPCLSDRIALYGSGDKQMLAEILPYRIKNSNKLENENERVSKLLGYWLWNSILRFPGVILNQIAAASFLNIDEKEFQKNEKLRGLFKRAIYKGPFSDIQEFWWRDDLEDILFEEKCEDGLQLAKKKNLRKIKNCKCSVDRRKHAGYYCMVTEKPVSDENSCSNVNWFPAGADLARISKPVFEDLAPWLGLY